MNIRCQSIITRRRVFSGTIYHNVFIRVSHKQRDENPEIVNTIRNYQKSNVLRFYRHRQTDIAPVT